MDEPCFKKDGSNPPVYGVHDVPLRKTSTSKEAGTMGLREFTFHKCPVSDHAVDDSTR
jgi:hypothetical protein